MAGPAAIGAGVSLLGNVAQMFYDNHQRGIDREREDAANIKNEQLQRDFAQNGIRWKVADAVAAGLHPLAALGAQTYGASPSYISGAGSGSGSAPHLANMGQDVSRAIQATRTDEERKFALLQLESASLDNDLKRSQLAKLNGQIGPPMATQATDPFNASGTVQVQPSKPTAHGSNSGLQAGSITDAQYVRTANGGLAIVPSKDVKESIEDNVVPETMWSLRNQLIPNFKSRDFYPDPKLYPPPKGKEWVWSVTHQAFMPKPIRYGPHDIRPSYYEGR